MSELNKPDINEDSKMPKETKIKIAIGATLLLAIVFLIFAAVGRVDHIETPPVVEETVPEDIDFDFDNFHIAKSSWQNGAWCALDKEAVTSINIVKQYEGPSNMVWTVDGMIFFATDEGAVYVQVGPGVHMLGSMHKAFADFPNATFITGLELLDTEAVTDMSYLFANSAFESIDISDWNTSHVTNFAYMLYDTSATKSINMNNMDLSKVVDISYMFANARALEHIYFENVDTSHILLMEGLFDQVGSAASLDPTIFHGTLNTISCTNMAYMFRWSNMGNMLELVQQFDTRNVENMEEMFYHSLNQYDLDLSHFDVSKVENMNKMFAETVFLLSVNMEGWNPENLITANYMFYDCNNLREFNQWVSAPKIQYASHMFANCYELLELDVTCFDGATLKDAEDMFYCVQYVEHIYSNGFTVEKYSPYMFEYCVSLLGPTPYNADSTSSDMATTQGYLTPTK